MEKMSAINEELITCSLQSIQRIEIHNKVASLCLTPSPKLTERDTMKNEPSAFYAFKKIKSS